MSIFLSRVTKDITVGDPPVTFTVRKLNGKALAKAAITGIMNARELIGPLGEDFKRELAEARKAKAAEQSEADAAGTPVPPVDIDDPVSNFDHDALCLKGIVSATEAADFKNPDVIADLDDEVKATLAEAILRLSKPALFQTVAEQQAARKND
jgi:hypothetical protein